MEFLFCNSFTTFFKSKQNYFSVCPPYTVCTNTRDAITQVRSYNNYHPSKSWFIKMRNSGNVLLHFKVQVAICCDELYRNVCVIFILNFPRSTPSSCCRAHTTNYKHPFSFWMLLY